MVTKEDLEKVEKPFDPDDAAFDVSFATRLIDTLTEKDVIFQMDIFFWVDRGYQVRGDITVPRSNMPRKKTIYDQGGIFSAVYRR